MLYQLVAAGTTDPVTAGTPLPFRPATEFQYLSQSGRFTIDGISDGKAWADTASALSSLGVSDGARLEMMRLLCGVLHMGSLSFEDEPNDANYDASKLCSDAGSQEALRLVGDLWGVNPEALAKSLTVRTTKSRRNSTYSVGMTATKATQNRDALAKAVYHRIFIFLVVTMNAQFVTATGAAPADLRWIGLLDAFGFELLGRNSMEQLLINATNELLQQFFLVCVMNAEAALYEAEQIPWTPIEYKDNAETIGLLLDKQHGLMHVLDEYTRLPNGTDERFAARMMEQLQKAGHDQQYTAYSKPKKGAAETFRGSTERRERTHRLIKALFTSKTPHFTVRHFAGEVCYETASWLDKNADTLFDDIRLRMLASDRPLLRQLFTEDFELNLQELPPPDKKGKGPSSVISAPTICTRFSDDLDSLMKELKLSTVHFVRCLKPNNELRPNAPDSSVLLDQLLFSGMLEAVQVRDRLNESCGMKVCGRGTPPF